MIYKEDENIWLKFGTLKGFMNLTEKSLAIVEEFYAAKFNGDVDEIGILCKLIDNINGSITNDWSGETMTKAQAKTYIRDYRETTFDV